MAAEGRGLEVDVLVPKLDHIVRNRTSVVFRRVPCQLDTAAFSRDSRLEHLVGFFGDLGDDLVGDRLVAIVAILDVELEAVDVRLLSNADTHILILVISSLDHFFEQPIL